MFVACFARVRNFFAFLIFGGWPVLHTPFVHASRGSCEGSINKSICLVNAFYLRLYAPKAYIHMIIKLLDENIVHETLVKKSELFRDSTVETNSGT